MGHNEFKLDDDVIRRFCARRGVGPEERDFLLSCARDRQEARDRLARSADLDLETRYVPVDDKWCEEKLTQMPDGPTLF